MTVLLKENIPGKLRVENVGNIKLVSSRGKKKGKKARRKTAAKTALIIILILLIGFATFTISLGFYVKSLDIVLPNVWADGIKLSGMTLNEAIQTLIDEGYESNADGVAATINFPDGSGFTITGTEAGFSFKAEDAAIAAYEYGREGSFFVNELTYVKAYLTRTDLRDLSLAMFSNKEYVREIVAEYTRAYNNTLVDGANDINISDERITVVKGAKVQRADEDSVYDLTVDTILLAMEGRSHLTADYTTAEAVIDEIDLSLLYDRIHVEPVSSQYDSETFSATESHNGITFDIDAAQAMLNNAGTGTQVVIPLLTVEPEVTQEDIESMLFRDVLSETTTTIGGTSNRLNNVILATEAVDGTQLNPGEVFSFNRIVGERTSARGYREANAYVSGKTVLEIGGGICQVSSTIYNCVLYAGLEVVERRAHGFTVSYLPLGNDATVAWGAIDFKFKNNTDYPIRVEAVVSGRSLNVKLIGTKLDDNYIKIEYKQISRTPIQEIEREDESVPPGQRIVDTDGYTGYVVDTYKYIYDGEDNLLSEIYVGRSSYNVQNKVILIPVAVPEDPDDAASVDDPGTDTETGPVTDPETGSVTDPATDPATDPDTGSGDNQEEDPGDDSSGDLPEDPTETQPDPNRQEPD